MEFKWSTAAGTPGQNPDVLSAAIAGLDWCGCQKPRPERGLNANVVVRSREQAQAGRYLHGVAAATSNQSAQGRMWGLGRQRSSRASPGVCGMDQKTARRK